MGDGWWRSPVWVLGVWVLVLVAFTLLGWLLIKRTGWGWQFWRLSSMFFVPHGRSFRALKPILTVALLLLFTVIEVRLNVLLSFQNNELFTALQQNDRPTFWRSIVASRATAPSVVLVRRLVGRRVEALASVLVANLPPLLDELRAGCIVVLSDDSVRVRRLPIG